MKPRISKGMMLRSLFVVVVSLSGTFFHSFMMSVVSASKNPDPNLIIRDGPLLLVFWHSFLIFFTLKRTKLKAREKKNEKKKEKETLSLKSE